ncbi:MAG: galactose-1-phosphate uridylyltransferase, partial [Kiritimatiellae bacterium]|nr:galactose-1-phosphate uridylyltransferase [Kiritimatiellia bacterium]
MNTQNLNQPHRRYNALTGDWILVSPHRTQRPWQGQQEKSAGDERPEYDPGCYLCPGNIRAGGASNPDYTAPFVFTNDYAAVLPDGSALGFEGNDLFRAEGVKGTCRVICFSPKHNLTLPEMPVDSIRAVIDVWAEETTELGKTHRWVQVFENKGSVMGCSNPHPHGQIWATDSLPNEPAKEEAAQKAYHDAHGSVLLLDYLAMELERKERIVEQNEHWVALVPFWAVWPFETLLLPRRHVLRLPDLTDDERNAQADILKRLLTRYDNLFECSFPYSMG